MPNSAVLICFIFNTAINNGAPAEYSGSDAKEYCERASESGLDAHLVKPWSPDDPYDSQEFITVENVKDKIAFGLEIFLPSPKKRHSSGILGTPPPP